MHAPPCTHHSCGPRGSTASRVVPAGTRGVGRPMGPLNACMMGEDPRAPDAVLPRGDPPCTAAPPAADWRLMTSSSPRSCRTHTHMNTHTNNIRTLGLRTPLSSSAAAAVKGIWVKPVSVSRVLGYITFEWSTTIMTGAFEIRTTLDMMFLCV